MADSPLYRVQMRRRREGKTDYRRRLALLKSQKPRLVVRRSLTNVTVQFVAYDEKGDRVLAAATAKELPKLGWTGATANTPAAYLAGLLAGKRFLESGAAADEDGNHAVLDIGLAKPAAGGRRFAALAGAIEAGVKIPHGDNVLPTDDRVRGEHVQGKNYAAAFAATFEKVMGRAPPEKRAPPKKKEKPKAQPAPAATKTKAQAPKPAADASAKKQDKGEKKGWAGKEKKAKSPE